jgi:hypothetical protein
MQTEPATVKNLMTVEEITRTGVMLLNLIKTSIRLSSRHWRNAAALFLLLGGVTVSGCGELSGQFGFKTFMDQAYKKVAGVPEFPGNKRIQWVFVFDEVKGKHSVGVIIQKKEIVWADVVKETKWITPERKILYGTIENYTEGEYKILILENNKIIGNQDFIVYQNDEDIE